MNWHKYGAKKTTVDGIEFSSRKEANRYSELKLLQKAKKIRGLELQPKFQLLASFTDFYGTKHREIAYVADFKYWDIENNVSVVEDVKGMQTPVYKLKKKMFLQKYAYKFVEL